MAAAPPSTAISKDPQPFSSLRKSVNLDSVYAVRTYGLKLIGCSSADIGSRKIGGKLSSSGFFNGGDGGFGGGFGLHKARVIGPHLIRELLAEDINFSLENSTFDAGGRYRSDNGSCLGAPKDPHLGPKKLMVAVDVDEVLGNFVSALNQFIAARYALNHSVSEYYVYEFFKIWNCSCDEADIRVHEFFKTPYFKKGIHPIPGAKQALQKLSRFYDLSIVTSRQNVIKDQTIEWIEKHFPGLFLEIHFGNHFALDGKSRPKSEICRSLGAKVLIDDNPRYAIECAEAGIRVLLFDYQNSYPWSKIGSVQQHSLITKVHNWEEVEHHLVSWTNS